MKATIVFVLVLWVALSAAAPQSLYTDKYDNVDLDDILRNDRLLNHYFKCLMKDNYRCSADGQELKKNLPDALANGCTKCSRKQRQGSEKILKFMINNKPAMWKELEAKYDPTGAYKKKYLNEKNELRKDVKV